MGGRRISFEYVSGSGSHSLRGLDTCSITQRVCYFQPRERGRESVRKGESEGMTVDRIRINIGYAFACVRVRVYAS